MTVSPSGEEYASFGRVEVEEELPRFLKRLNAFRHEYETSHSRDLALSSDLHLPASVCHYERGRTYVKIVAAFTAECFSPHIFGFIRLADGAILKPASWKAPYTRGIHAVRGYIFDEDVSIACDYYGVRYYRGP